MKSRHRKRPDKRRKKQKQEQQARHRRQTWQRSGYRGGFPSPLSMLEVWPELSPTDRLSSFMDYRTIIPDYDQAVAEMGKEEADELLDYFFYFLMQSWTLANEPELADFYFPIDPYDFLIYETHELIMDLVDQGQFDAEAFYGTDENPNPRFDHIIRHGLERHFTPRVQRGLKRRVQRIEAHNKGRVIGSIASAVALALEDFRLPPLIIALVVRLYSAALLDGVLNLPKQYKRDWEERDRRLDRWGEEICQGSFEQPAEEAVRRLIAAGERALPILADIIYERDYYYEDYPVLTALEIAGHIPCQRSLRMLLDALIEDIGAASELAFELLPTMPELACPYFRYALTRPKPLDWEIVMYGYPILGRARCEGAFDIIVQGLRYQGEDDFSTESIQCSAWESLLELGDPRAVPVLLDYLRDEAANEGAKEELLHVLATSKDKYPLAQEIVEHMKHPDRH